MRGNTLLSLGFAAKARPATAGHADAAARQMGRESRDSRLLDVAGVPLLSTAAFAVRRRSPLANGGTSITGISDGTGDSLLFGSPVAVFEIGPPAAEAGDVDTARQTMALAEESLDQRAVAQRDRADAERRRHA
jgi:hypothetical protein